MGEAAKLENKTKVLDEDWNIWYQKTFSSELSLISNETLLDVLNNPASNPVKLSSRTESETNVLKRRLRAVDAIESLSQQVESAAPISTALWEVDADECRSCKKDLGWTRLRRRHHCRYCGLIFCGDCTPGEIRRCTFCHVRKTRFEAIKVLRGFEREVGAADGFTREGVLSVVRAYRVAIQSFSTKPGDSMTFVHNARSTLLEGMHSFLELTETKMPSKVG